MRKNEGISALNLWMKGKPYTYNKANRESGKKKE